MPHPIETSLRCCAKRKVQFSLASDGRFLVGLVSNEGHNHAVQVEEKQNEVEAELGEGFLLVNVKLAENLSGVQEVGVVNDLLDVPGNKGHVEDERQPVTVDKEKEGQETVNGDFGDDVGVKAVAEVNRVDVIAFEIAVHDGEEDLEKEVDGVYKHRKQV